MVKKRKKRNPNKKVQKKVVKTPAIDNTVQSTDSGKDTLDMDHVKSLMKQKRYSEVLDLLQDDSYAIEKDLKYELTLGEALMETGKLDEALQSFEGTVEKYPNNFWGYALKGRCLFKQGRDDDAKALFENVIEMFPSEAEILETYNIYRRDTKEEKSFSKKKS